VQGAEHVSAFDALALRFTVHGPKILGPVFPILQATLGLGNPLFAPKNADGAYLEGKGLVAGGGIGIEAPIGKAMFMATLGVAYVHERMIADYTAWFGERAELSHDSVAIASGAEIHFPFVSFADALIGYELIFRDQYEEYGTFAFNRVYAFESASVLSSFIVGLSFPLSGPVDD
jgi:hypothetical protein